MKKSKIKTLSLFLAVALTLTLGLSGCSTQSAPTASPSASKAPAASAAPSTAAKTKITVATGGAPKPFSYVDDKNQLTGYDIEVVKTIFAQLPQYEVTFEKTEFASIFAGLDSDRYQIGANNFAMNEARKQKYIYTDPIFKNQYVVAVPADRTDIKSFTDLLGKTTEVNSGVNYTTALENYNKNHTDKPVKLSYSDADLVSILQRVESGKFDFQLIDAAILNNYIKNYGLKLKAVPLSDDDSKLIGAPYSYLILSKGQYSAQLEKDINATLKKLLADGTITKISQKFFNGDFAPKA